jgi:hypothetical protein
VEVDREVALVAEHRAGLLRSVHHLAGLVRGGDRGQPARGVHLHGREPGLDLCRHGVRDGTRLVAADP